ncbi:type VII secretion protein EccB [Mycolicibacterium diernhoferi]|uniref:Type VII secretion protein EccB n=1 Tax=Mycolicibacterium diernhoferi TaxID=1801 RepID=A0A1Q4HHZ5_9MYCO|nr:type VII secretion protein EccB [Mycolicibacterium diernhoferi]OJZ67105.1 type VII secretion protein EccB [Mycolicibacterium diernhoferi]OPE54807.1 type VII secretion protein EccB [Mycolicibacterium diernhoferi]PEG53673.1 type VII secretion protein EccB [Mycolicibacterium diernhoferi]QYL23302.1 type VII secretion protein EccB [Mycolicibacterium diernhoferi]
MSETGEERREFTSRTPVNDNPERVVHRRGFVTRHQVSGWRFVMRRIASGVALHDTRMLVDPLRTQNRAVLVGALVSATVVAGCFVFSLFRPGGDAGSATILADRDTSALYVRIGDVVHPALNLTSARLIAGQADNPTTVKSSEIDKFARGNLIGIPGAPERMVQNSSRDANWTVCDAVSGSTTGVTLIAGAPDLQGERATALPADRAVLIQNVGGVHAGTWLLWDGKRSPIDLGNRAVTSALGLGNDIPAPRVIDPGLFNAIPESAPLVAPALPGAGEPPRFDLPVPAPVGAVVAAFEADNTIRYYAVHADGLQPISPVLAAILRNSDSYGLQQPPRLGADEVAKLPVAGGIDTAAYPADEVTLAETGPAPVTCAYWSKPADATESRLTLLSGAALPLPEGQRTVQLVGAGGGSTADHVALTPGSGYFVQSVGSAAGAPPAGSAFWVSDTGVRYGVDTSDDAKSVAALGLNPPPLAVPWSMLAQFAPGPTLSKADALVAHDAVAPVAAAGPEGENE